MIPDEEGFGLAALVEGEAMLWECVTGVIRLRRVQEIKMYTILPQITATNNIHYETSKSANPYILQSVYL